MPDFLEQCFIPDILDLPPSAQAHYGSPAEWWAARGHDRQGVQTLFPGGQGRGRVISSCRGSRRWPWRRCGHSIRFGPISALRSADRGWFGLLVWERNRVVSDQAARLGSTAGAWGEGLSGGGSAFSSSSGSVVFYGLGVILFLQPTSFGTREHLTVWSCGGRHVDLRRETSSLASWAILAELRHAIVFDIFDIRRVRLIISDYFGSKSHDVGEWERMDLARAIIHFKGEKRLWIPIRLMTRSNRCTMLGYGGPASLGRRTEIGSTCMGDAGWLLAPVTRPG